jgi:polynucleotide 5'-kinase involved in rRNA processing
MRKSLNLAELDVFINECVSCVPRCFCKIKEEVIINTTGCVSGKWEVY